MLLVLCATISGMEDFVEIRLWGQERMDFLRRFLSYKRIHPANLSITHISDVVFALSESFVILFVTPIRGGVTDERGEGSRYIWLA
jgi:hypothetical protein